jgi:protein-disulfide isomerase
MNLRRRELLGLGAVAAAGVGATAWLRSRPPPPVRLELTPVVATVLDDPGSPRVGPPDTAGTDADVTVVVFTDYQCPICRTDAPAFARLIADDPGVRVIFKDWPVRGEGSRAAARAALAAAVQGRYLAFHQALMAAPGRLDAARLPGLAAAAGLDPQRLAADQVRDAVAIDAQLARHALQAFSLGLKGTPGYIVGPWLYPGSLAGDRLTQALARARRSGPLRA